jgi:hypothetical protein
METAALRGPKFDRLLADVPPGYGMLAELRSYGQPDPGDHKWVWNPESKDEVEIAETTFNNLIAKGFEIFRVADGGGAGEQIKKFDKRAAKLIAIKPVMGG